MVNKSLTPHNARLEISAAARGNDSDQSDTRDGGAEIDERPIPARRSLHQRLHCFAPTLTRFLLFRSARDKRVSSGRVLIVASFFPAFAFRLGLAWLSSYGC